MEPVGTLGQGPQVGVGGFGVGIGQVVVEGVPDEVAVMADAPGPVDELGDAAVAGPRQPPGQQLPALVALDPKDLAELLFEQIRPVEGVVGGGDAGRSLSRFLCKSEVI